MISWSNPLIRDLALRKCIIVLGAGISMNSQNAAGVRPKHWLGFLQEGVSRLASTRVKRDVKKLIKNNDFLTACELIKETIGRSAFVDLMMDEFQTPGFQPAEIHQLIFKLDSKIVVTPNFDTIYDRYAQSESNGTVTIKKHSDDDLAESIRANKRLIIKMHGSIESPNDVIFTRSDYANARIKYSNFYSIFDALAITNTFLFLGCGTSDPDIRLILEDYRYKFKYSREHYFLLSRKYNPISVNRILESTLNLKIIQYDPKNNHEVLADSLRQLVQLVETKREEISEKQSW